MPGAATSTEPWFTLDYAEAPLPADILEEWASAAPALELALPQPNAFIASDFAVVAEVGNSSGVGGSGDAAKDGELANGAVADSAEPPLQVGANFDRAPQRVGMRWR